ncbi:MAG: TonB-dependent receptor plug domain-containing protein [Desulfuromonadaceae bacterium]
MKHHRLASLSRNFFYQLTLYVVCTGTAWCEAPVIEARADLSELSMEQLMQIEVENVVTASRFTQQVTEAPASMSVVTGDDIRKYGYRTLADILRSVPGLYVTYDRNYSYLGARGFSRPGDYNSRFLLMIDGHRLNDGVYDTAQIGTEFPLDIDLIDRIEVMRGPGSSLYGSNAFFGVINVITRAAEDVRREISTSGASYESWTGRASYGASFDSGLDLLLSGSLYDSAGQNSLYFPEYAATPSRGYTYGSDDDSSKSVYARVSHSDVTLTGLFSSREKGIPTGAYQTVFNDPATRTTDERGYLNLGYRKTYSEALEVSAQLFYDHYKYDGTYITDNSPSAGIRSRDSALGTSWGADSVVIFTPLPENKLSLGFEFRQNLIQHQKNVTVDPLSVNLDDHRDSVNWGGFIQDEYIILKPLRINAGVRYDNYDSFDSFNPRAALVYTPVETTALKLLYSEAFRAPNVYERYYQDGATAIAHPGLKPEKIRTVDAIWEQYFLDNYRSSFGGFYYRVTDLISQTTDAAGMLVYNNIDSAEAVGIAASLEGFWQSGLKGRLSYNWQQATNQSTGAQLSNSPRHLAKANMSIPLIREQLFISPELQYTGPRITLNGSRTNNPILANLTVFCRDVGLKGLETSASLYNLFNVHGEDVAGEEHGPALQTIRQDGISFRVKLSYRF